MIVMVLGFIIILSIIVIIHELGHYFTARFFGIKVEEFGIGFPPRAFGIKRGETIYSINWLPVGGFVKLYGEDDAGGGSVKRSKSELKKENSEHDLKRAFFARPAWQRALVVVAGVVMNLVLAVVIISFLFAGPGVAVPTENIKISDVVEKAPAALAGIKSGDQLISVNGKRIEDTNDFISLTKESEGEEMSLVLLRNGENFKVDVTPRKVFPEGQGPLGVQISNVDLIKYPWYQAPFYGTVEVGKFSWMILTGLGGIAGNLATKGEVPKDAAGPVGIAQLIGEIFKNGIIEGLIPALWIAAVISLNLAIINILPIPALDGGRLFFILIEMVTRKKVPQKYESMAHAVGLVVLLALFVLITVFDVSRLLSGQTLIPKK